MLLLIHTVLATAIELSQSMDMTFWLPQAEATLAQVGGDADGIL